MEQISLFDESEYPRVNKGGLPVILSASRMTDMSKYYPAELINEVESRLKKGTDIHTLVLWSKHPDSLITPVFSAFLKKLRGLGIQIYFQCTITGMGQKIIDKGTKDKPLLIEPNSPSPQKALSDLKEVIDLLGSPLRVHLRVDPLIKIKSKSGDKTYTNLNMVEPLVLWSSMLGIKTFSVSFLEQGIYRKVDKRFEEIGWRIITPSIEQKAKASEWLSGIAEKYNVKIDACCVQGLPESRCIDGYLLQELHPDKRPVRLDEPRKRSLCACTHSIDIGGWPPKKCYTGCQYCYANSSYNM